MYRVFFVSEGVSLAENLPPTSNVSTLQSVLGRKCKVGSKDVVLLSSKGHLLDAKETLGAYDAGTDEKPVFVFFRPEVTPQYPYLHQPYTRNQKIESLLTQLTSSPSPTALQHQLNLGNLLAQEALRLISTSQQLRTNTHLQWIGWQALLHNFSAIHRTFDKHHRALGWGLVNHQSSRSSYEDLLTRSPNQLEILKKVVLPSSLGHGAFDGHTGSLYEWISSQDEHSSLPDLIRECSEALKQVNETSLEQLQALATQLIGSAEQLIKRETIKNIVQDVDLQEIEKVAQEQQSMAQSLQVTIQRVLGNGDAGALANVSLSNQRLVQLMHGNHQLMETKLKELESVRSSLKEKISGGLKALANLQQEMMEMDAQLLFYCEHLQLTRRRFEVLEQICAAPEMLFHVVYEIEQRQRFKKQYMEIGQRMAAMFEHHRQKEKSRRQKFLESYSQHFILSLFPSFTDRIPRLMTSIPDNFDEDLCSLSQDTLNSISHWLPRPSSTLDELVSLNCEKSIQTDTSVHVPLVEHLNTSVQVTPQYSDGFSQVYSHTEETGSQTIGIEFEDMMNKAPQASAQHVETGSQTIRIELKDLVSKAVQVSAQCVETGSQILPDTLEALVQVHFKGEDSEVQTDLIDMINTGIQTHSHVVDTGAQTNSDECVNTKTLLEHSDVYSQTHIDVTDSTVQVNISPNSSDAIVQTHTNVVEASVQTHPNVVEAIVQTIPHSTKEAIVQTHITKEDNVQTHPDVRREDSVQTHPYVTKEASVQTELYTMEVESNTSEAGYNVYELQGQVVALQAAVSGLKSQLVLERDTNRKQVMELEREMKHHHQSYTLSRDTTDDPPLTSIAIGNLRVGDTALFIQDSLSNFLAVTVDSRIYYLNHASAECFTSDVNSRIQAPIKRKVLIGTITEKLLVEVRKENNRLKVPIGQRLYKVSARESVLPVITA